MIAITFSSWSKFMRSPIQVTSKSKLELIQTRVPATIKTDFEAICSKQGITPSVKARDLFERFVNDNRHLLDDRLIINIYKPEGYDFGAWRIMMLLKDPFESFWGGSAIPFELPELKNRRISSDKEFQALVVRNGDYKFGGAFDSVGRWCGHVYSNGVFEQDNPTSIERVQTELRNTVTTLFDKFKGLS